ncbi:C-type lectin domain family 5 member A-like isoform X1 [Prinia subflava]|uniref:C-type lectin domain family 5 member A-like isoform X1 n=1 Tax=Prinia subflava TaxID=208062 RepID=UPI002FDF69AB
MAENVLYADLNLPESITPRILTVTDVQGSDCTYAEVKVKSQDTNAAANCKSSGKSCCSRKHAAILVVIIPVLVLAIYLIITYGPTTGSQNSSTTLSLIPEEALDCPSQWKKHGRKCYFFSPEKIEKNWNDSRRECFNRGSDLVIIDSEEELSYLRSESNSSYYLLGLTFSQNEQKWKWINDMEYDPAMFNIKRQYSDYHCAVIGPRKVEDASCGGSSTTQNMCEKAATMLKRHQKES